MSIAAAGAALETSKIVTSRGPIPLLINDRAGALKRTAGPEEIQRMAEEIGLELNVIPTASPDEMCQKILRLAKDGSDRIAVAGGDGTVALAARTLANTGVTLGIVPQGTANNFATALRLPQELPAALRVLHEGDAKEVDLGRVGDHYFTEAAGVGLFADALALYGGANKNALRAGYSILRILFSARARRLRLFIDGELHTERAVMVTAANTFRLGYAVPIAPGAKLTDGVLDIVVVGDLKRRELIPYFRAMKAQTHQSLPEVKMLRGREVRIESRSPMNVHADDTVIGATPVTISAAPRALKVLVDRL